MAQKQNGNRGDARLMKHFRETVGLSQREAADLLGLVQGSISHIETEARPLSTLQRKEMDRVLLQKRVIAGAADGRWAACRGWRSPPAEFVRHAETCFKCQVRLVVQRRHT